jgi:hypothetical protein
MKLNKGALPLMMGTYAHKFGLELFMYGHYAYTDGKRITIPRVDLSNGKMMELAFGYVAHECGHVRYSDFELMGNVFKNNVLANLYNAVEDVRVEYLQIRDWPGLEDTFDFLVKENFSQLLKTLKVFKDKKEISSIIAIYVCVYLRFNVLGQKSLLEILNSSKDILMEEFGENFVLTINSIIQNVEKDKSSKKVFERVKRLYEFIVSFIVQLNKSLMYVKDLLSSMTKNQDKYLKRKEYVDNELRFNSEHEVKIMSLAEYLDYLPDFIDMSDNVNGRSVTTGNDNIHNCSNSSNNGCSSSNITSKCITSAVDKNVQSQFVDNRTFFNELTEEELIIHLDKILSTPNKFLKIVTDYDFDGRINLNEYLEVISEDELKRTDVIKKKFLTCADFNFNNDCVMQLSLDRRNSKLRTGIEKDIAKIVKNQLNLYRDGKINDMYSSKEYVLHSNTHSLSVVKKFINTAGEVLESNSYALSSKNDYGVLTSKEATPNKSVNLKNSVVSNNLLLVKLMNLVKGYDLFVNSATNRGSYLNVHNYALRKVNCYRNIFNKKTQKRYLNTTIHLLVDISGSMGNYDNDGSTARYEIANEVALCLGMALEAIPRIKLFVSYFPGISTEVEEVYKPNQKIRNRMEFFFQQPRGCTPLTQALTHALYNFDFIDKFHRNIIIIITDGEPDNVQSTKELLMQAKESMVEVFAVRIGQNDKNKELFDCYEHITDVSILPETMVKLLKRGLFDSFVNFSQKV